MNEKQNKYKSPLWNVIKTMRFFNDLLDDKINVETQIVRLRLGYAHVLI